ncbi:hypothetical protein KEH51_26980 [[Brevibacterium] frigoritolerans]|uniref:Uncharacterized protein n=1 Tax=Peribacillus frigoritolerans TaxID=450367 RepID=A0A941J6J7_9BACI|nr:hypothetical protein [Peribacillus frigoritolerans]
MEILKATRQDAGKLAALINHVEDSGFMLYNPGKEKQRRVNWRGKSNKLKVTPAPFSSLQQAAAT